MSRISCFKLFRKGNRSGLSLIAAVGLLLLTALAVAVLASLAGTGNIGTAHAAQSAQAFGIAHAGAEWTLEVLSTIPSWAGLGGVSVTIPFAGGNFDITVNVATTTSVNFTSVGRITGMDGNEAERRMTITAKKLPAAHLFALYVGNDPGGNIALNNNTLINGDVWSIASVSVSNNSTVTPSEGTIFVPDTQTVGGGGTFVAKQIAPPFPVMPAFDSTGYINEMNSYDAQISSIPPSAPQDINQSTNLDLNAQPGNTVQCRRDFSTSGNLVISGQGFIIAGRDINLHNIGGRAGPTLDIQPGGRGIFFLARENMVIGGTNNNPVIDVQPGATFYAQNSGGRGDFIQIHRLNTRLAGARILARRRIVIDAGAAVTSDSFLFVDRVSPNANNQIQINGGRGGATVSGSVISISNLDPNLRIHNGATFSGLVYSNGGGRSGRLDLSNCTITGTVVASLLQGDRVAQADITYDPTAVPDPPPAGFQAEIIQEPNTWDGL